MKKTSSEIEKSGLHPRNRHRTRYDFEALTKALPELKPFLITNKFDAVSIDFSNPAAVIALNKALLFHFYQVSFWEIPAGFLCPPVPGRADYLHHAADLMALVNRSTIPTGPSVKVLDIGVGANCIYPIIGRYEYGWSFVGSEIDYKAVESAKKIVESNPLLSEEVSIRLQKAPSKIFQDIIGPEDEFDLVICNPPFHSDMKEAEELNSRKWQNLGVKKERKEAFNFGGNNHELTYPGGEVAFVSNMIRQSVGFATKVYWFTSLVSRSENMPEIMKVLKRFKPTSFHVIEMEHGNKASRVIAWTFLDNKQQTIWKERRFW